MRPPVALIAMALASACVSRPVPIPLQGDPTSIAWLSGDWTGDFRGRRTDRRGTLSFFLQAGTDSLYGDVMMMDPFGNMVHPVDAVDAHLRHVRVPRQLHVDFVALRADTVRGVLEPYTSPDCDCIVTTTFIGWARGDTISGTFRSEGGARYTADGEWRVSRTGSTRRP